MNELISSRSALPRKYLFAAISICLLVYVACWRFPQVMAFAGVSNEGVWFLDTFAVLAAVDAKGLGLDPYAPNPLNYFRGTHVYSNWWFALGHFPISRYDTVWLGFLVVVLFLVTAWLVLRPRTAREGAWSVGVLCSAPIILALNRANSDLLIFVILSACIPALLSRVRFCRLWVPPTLIAFTAGLKYYPALAGMIVLSVRNATDRWISSVIAAVLLCCVGISVAPGLFHYTSDRLPQGLHTFGARVSLEGAGFSGPSVAGMSIAFLLIAGGWIASKSLRSSWRIPPEQERDYCFFIMGAVVLTGSFVATVNYGYRWVYAVWMIPFLCRKPISIPSAGVVWLTGATRILLMVALWSHACVAMILNSTVHSVVVAEWWIGVFVALEQPLIWGFFLCLGAWLSHFVFVQLLLPLRSSSIK